MSNTLIIDDNTADVFSFGSSTTFIESDLDGSYNSTIHESTSTEHGDEFVTITFTGSSIALIGNTTNTQVDPARTFTVSIDGGRGSTVSYDDPSPPSYRQWYQSPNLSDGPHTLTLSNVLQGASIDYAVITTSQTSLVNAFEQLIIDDSSPAITYSGSGWTSTKDTFRLIGSSPNTTIVPYGGSSHRTNTPGDSISITVQGPSAGGLFSGIALYGLVEYTQPGVLNLSFSIDGGQVDSTTFFMTPEDKNVIEGRTIPNLLFIGTSPVSDGEHTLTVTLDGAEDQSFIVDYLTSTAFPVIQSRNVISSPQRKTNVGAIVGGVIGGIVLLLLAAFFFTSLRRRKQIMRTRLMFRNRFFGSQANRDTGIPLSSLTSPEHAHIGDN